MNKTMYYTPPGLVFKGNGKKKKNMRGGSFFGDVWSGIKSVVRPVANFVKDNKLISTGLSLVPDPRAKVAGAVAGKLGLGRKRRAKKRKPANKSGKGKKGELVLPNALNAHKMARARVLKL